MVEAEPDRKADLGDTARQQESTQDKTLNLLGFNGWLGSIALDPFLPEDLKEAGMTREFAAERGCAVLDDEAGL